jgi:excisionase family DNA binding protein
MTTKKKSAPKQRDESEMIGFSLSSLMDAAGGNLDTAASGDEEFLTVTQAAELRGCSRVAIHELITRKRIKAIKAGRQFLIPRRELENFERQKPGPTGPKGDE